MVQGNLCGNADDFSRLDVDKTSVLTAILKLNNTADLCEEGVIFATADVCAGLERCSTLPDDDAAAEDSLSTEYLDAKPLCI